jgi:glycosyltransferase involved in cell wall biosynthesis
VKIAYLINQYPQASQSFIRREIAALEKLGGITVERFTVRRWDQKLVDPGDIAEQQRARVVLDAGGKGLLGATLKTLFSRPAAFFRALKTTLRCARRGDRGLLYHLIYLAEACVLRQWFAQSGIDHVHAHFGTNSTTVALLVRALGGPSYSFTCHGPEEFDKPEFLKLPDKIRHAAFVVAVSEFGRSQLFRWCGHEHWSKIHVVHCGVDASFLQGIGGGADPAAGHSRKLVCVGRLAEQKGQLLLVQAAAQLAAAGEDFEIVLVGDGPMRAEIESLIERFALQGKVRIAGWMSNDQVRQQLLESRAMVLPSFAEGLPVVCMEALALRRPVISTFVAGIPELVEPGVCGWLVPAGAVAPLADAMRAALQADDQTLRSMGDAGASRVAAHHDADREAHRLADLFQKAAASGATASAAVAPAAPLPNAVSAPSA